MAILSTGPIENSPVSGVRPAQLVTIRINNRSSQTAASVLIEGFYFTGIRNLYVSEVINVAPDEAVTRNYFADLDGYEFVFTTSGIMDADLAVSVWGKQTDGQLVEAHRVASREIMN
ncbi:hypothetical protein R70723_26370 [Paenibacillus sp. FSL R7-0273]|uniref:hypothetical protein n=1 Tax=Paenibacillus sp. FSL R7-0273 TaxID=1536772 RepID=UPI0004F90F40|nr:hypothetical protein [Paenibacillus sp. FSL R7-0273]AIQ49034.1 hypothetical protein R70723_26370 [Paenibacillus sp. FSL R7-0273]OMF90592.1 hypothetical protein BK144_17425 [Paenibacillus sp. FSL R7-0273]